MPRLTQANASKLSAGNQRPIAALLRCSLAALATLLGGSEAARAAAPAGGQSAVHVIVHMRPENPPAPPAGYVYMVNGVLPIGPPLRDPRPDAVLVLDTPNVDSIANPAANPASAAGGDDPAASDDPPAGAAEKDAAPADAAVPPSTTPPIEVRIYGARTLPEVIVAPAGTQVIFRNDDRRSVSLHCRQAPELFPRTGLAPGTRLAVTAPRPGEFELRSAEYPHLRATLIVPRGPAAHLTWSAMGEVGEARLNVPPGNYLARLFFLHRYVAAQAVTVTPQGAEFVLRAVWPTATIASAAPSR